MGTRRRGIAVGIGAGITVVVTGLGLWHWSVTVPSDAVVAEVGRIVGDAYVDARRTPCPREVLRGTPLAGDGARALRELVSADGAYGSCLVALAPVDGESTDVVIPPSCAGIELEVAEALQHESVCSPLPIGDEPHGVVHYVRLARVLAAIAGARAEEGRVQEGLEIALDALRLASDVARGRVSFLASMIASAMVDAPVQTLTRLMRELPRDAPIELASLERQALVLGRTQSGPEHWAEDDILMLLRAPLEQRGWTVPRAIEDEMGPALPWGEDDPHAYDRALVGAQADLARARAVCAGATTRRECVEAWRTEAVRAEPSWFASLVDPSLVDYAETVRSVSPYFVRAAEAEAAVRAVVALFVHRRLAATGDACVTPGAVEAELRRQGIAEGVGGTFSVRACPDDPCRLSVRAPEWLTEDADDSPVVLLESRVP
ncbi:MAG: hypothetical protein J0L92_15865 [Deltaproteobacteria bacterium]|nr:hypothetical protein [Deltaproteobacteria bacterium]